MSTPYEWSGFYLEEEINMLLDKDYQKPLPQILPYVVAIRFHDNFFGGIIVGDSIVTALYPTLCEEKLYGEAEIIYYNESIVFPPSQSPFSRNVNDEDEDGEEIGLKKSYAFLTKRDFMWGLAKFDGYQISLPSLDLSYGVRLGDKVWCINHRPINKRFSMWKTETGRISNVDNHSRKIEDFDVNFQGRFGGVVVNTGGHLAGLVVGRAVPPYKKIYCASAHTIKNFVYGGDTKHGVLLLNE